MQKGPPPTLSGYLPAGTSKQEGQAPCASDRMGSRGGKAGVPVPQTGWIGRRERALDAHPLGAWLQEESWTPEEAGTLDGRPPRPGSSAMDSTPELTAGLTPPTALTLYSEGKNGGNPQGTGGIPGGGRCRVFRSPQLEMQHTFNSINSS